MSNRKLLLEAIEEYQAEVPLDGFIFRRPNAANIIALRDFFKEGGELNHVEHLGLILSHVMDKEDTEGISMEQLGLIVVARGGINGEFFQQVTKLAGLDIEKEAMDPLDSPNSSESPPEN